MFSIFSTLFVAASILFCLATLALGAHNILGKQWSTLRQHMVVFFCTALTIDHLAAPVVAVIAMRSQKQAEGIPTATFLSKLFKKKRESVAAR